MDPGRQLAEIREASPADDPDRLVVTQPADQLGEHGWITGRPGRHGLQPVIRRGAERPGQLSVTASPLSGVSLSRVAPSAPGG